MAAIALVGNMIAPGGGPASGCKLTSCIRSTSTPSPLYSDVGLTTPTTNPFVADADGRLDFYFDSTIQYTWTVRTADDGTIIWQADIVGGVLSVTYIDGILIHSTWAVPLANPLGDGWAAAFGLPLPDGLSGQFIKPVATYAALTALTEAVGLQDNAIYCTYARATEEDGGFGFWRYDAGSLATANGGTILAIDGGGTGRFLRLHDGDLYPEWFGSSADWGAAFTAAFTAIAAAGGTLKNRPGGDYTFTTQVVCPATENNIRWDIGGSKMRPRYASGATFKFGDGATLMQEITIFGESCIIDPGSTSEGGPTQPVFEFRGVRGAHLEGIRGVNWYSIAKWGDPADSVKSLELWLEDFDVNMRLNSDGGHSHGIAGDGAAGGLRVKSCNIEADAANVSGAVNFLNLTSAQGPDRLDYVDFQGPLLKGWDRVVSAVDARVTNMECDSASRFDEVVDAAIYVEATSGASQGGCEVVRIAGTLGSGPSGTTGKLLRIKADKSTSGISFEDIIVHDAICSKSGGPAVQVSTSGTGAVRGLHVNGLHMADADPTTSSQDAVILDGDIDEASVQNVSITHKALASNTLRYGIYNNTVSTKSVRIAASVMMDTFGTGVVYDPNIGDLSVGRYCALRTDGTPRGSHTFGPFVKANFAAGQTNENMAFDDGGNLVAVSARAPDRGRITDLVVQLTGTVSTNSLTIGAATGGSIDTNLDVDFTSADGANPGKQVHYRAGSAAVAQNGALLVRYTTHASLTPTTLDAAAWLIFEEM